MGNPIKDVLDESAEWHSFGLGIYRAFMPLDTAKLSVELQNDLRNEYHYHLFGYWFSRLIQTLFIFFIGTMF